MLATAANTPATLYTVSALLFTAATVATHALIHEVRTERAARRYVPLHMAGNR